MSSIRLAVRVAAVVAPLGAAAQSPRTAPPRTGTTRAATVDPMLVHYDVRDLPLVELPPSSTGGAAARTLVVFITGDGDWAELDRGVSQALAQAGAGIVGLKARSYLQSGTRTPGGLAADVERIARHYMPLWSAERLVLVGYSRGAEFQPFVANRLPADLRARIGLVAMLGLSRNANFQFHWTDIVHDRSRPSDLPVAPELAQLRGVRLLCIYGDDEKDSGCRDGAPDLMLRVERPGGHHLGGDYPALGALILGALTRG